MNTEKQLNILIADDEEGLRFSLASILEIEGYSVQTAGDGLEALELVKNNAFDIAFFDIRMPGMNGVEAFKKIKEISPETIVVMMTAYAMNDLIKEAIKEGAFACISKPFEIEDVLSTVKEINSKKTGLIISQKNIDAEDLLISILKSSGFIAVSKPDFKSAEDFIKRREPELVFAIEPSSDDSAAIKDIAGKLGKSKVVVATSSECKEFEEINNIKCVRLPLNKSVLGEFFSNSDKKKAAIISSDTIWSNNLKIAVVAKGYDVTYYPSVENIFEGADMERYDFVICDAGEIADVDNFYAKVKEKNGKAKVIFIFDFESSVSENLKKLNISFLQKPFDSQDLLAAMEKQQEG